MKSYWVSCPSFTVRVGVDGGGIIREAAPIVRRFIGQPLGNLGNWLSKLGKYEMEEL